MKVFVTAGTGYIGNAVVAALCRAGHDVKEVVHEGLRYGWDGVYR